MAETEPIDLNAICSRASFAKWISTAPQRFAQCISSKTGAAFIFLLIASTAFFLYQHTLGVSWDFSVYVLNAKYWLANGAYFEWVRPPLATAMIGAFSAFGWKAAEYIYIIAVSALFGFATWKLAQKLKINHALFYALLLTPFVLLYGLSVGTELLSLALVMLLLAAIDQYWSGILAGLMVLTRYPNLSFLPLLLFSGKIKKIISNIAIAIAVALPWLAFNWLMSGSPLTSLADAYAMNVAFRDYIHQPFSLLHILIVGLYLIPPAALGIYLKLKNSKGEPLLHRLSQYDLAMLLLLAINIIAYSQLPMKIDRYLFFITLPLAYFSVSAMQRFRWKKVVIVAVIICSFVIAGVWSATPFINPAPLKEIASPGCMIYSDNWPIYNYLGYPAAPTPHPSLINATIARGGRIIYCGTAMDTSYATEDYLSNYSIINRSKGCVVIGEPNSCEPPRKFNATYLSQVSEWTGKKYDGCRILLPDFLCA